MRDRAKRCRPKAAARSRILPRDMDALASLARAGFLTTTQLTRLHFAGSARVAQRRLRALLDHGLVVGALEGEQLHRASIFRPTKRGLELLADEGRPADATPARLPRTGKLRHAVATRDVFVAAVELELRGAWRLERVAFDSELAGDAVLRAATLVPDLLIRTRAPLGRAARVLLVEVDLGTEPLATLASKLDRYDALRVGAAEYAGAEVVFVIAGDARRRRFEHASAGRHVRVVGASELREALACSHEMFVRPVRGERTASLRQVPKITSVSGLGRRGM